ncbi:MAG: flagellar basal body rod protein FlgB [Calditrichota bacterium]
MITDHIFNSTRIPLLVKGLDAYSLRHRAIADNIVNTETVGYQRKQVIFESKLKAAEGSCELAVTNAKHFTSSGGSAGLGSERLEPEIALDAEPSDVNGLNNIDIDREMVDLARNHGQFNFAAKMTKQYFELLQLSIRGM